MFVKCDLCGNKTKEKFAFNKQFIEYLPIYYGNNETASDREKLEGE